MKKLLLLAILSLSIATVYAQEGGEVPLMDEYTTQLAKNAVFAEGEVRGTFYTLNFDRIIIAKPKYKISTSIGAGVSSLAFKGDIDPVINLSLNFLFGNSSHKLEASAGILTAIGDKFTPESIDVITQNGVQIQQFTPEREHTSLYITGRLGYRFQSDKGGLFLRLGVLPSIALYTNGGGLSPKIGGSIGLGFIFKNKPLITTKTAIPQVVKGYS